MAEAVLPATNTTVRVTPRCVGKRHHCSKRQCGFVIRAYTWTNFSVQNKESRANGSSSINPFAISWQIIEHNRCDSLHSLYRIVKRTKFQMFRSFWNRQNIATFKYSFLRRNEKTNHIYSNNRGIIYFSRKFFMIVTVGKWKKSAALQTPCYIIFWRFHSLLVVRWNISACNWKIDMFWELRASVSTVFKLDFADQIGLWYQTDVVLLMLLTETISAIIIDMQYHNYSRINCLHMLLLFTISRFQLRPNSVTVFCIVCVSSKISKRSSKWAIIGYVRLPFNKPVIFPSEHQLA